MLNLIMLSVVMLNVVMLSAVMLIVQAPYFGTSNHVPYFPCYTLILSVWLFKRLYYHVMLRLYALLLY
jgi:hypothetical protein